LNFRQALKTVVGEDEAVVTELATVLVSKVNHAEVDEGQALVAFAGQSRESVPALDAKTHAVVLNAVGDGTGNAGAPVGSLGESVRALGADISAGNVEVAVVDLFQATVLHKNEGVGAGVADGGGGILTVRETSGDVSYKSTGCSILEIVALSALDTTTEIIDGFAKIISHEDAVASGVVVQITGVAFGAVKIVHILQATGRASGLSGYQRKAEANRESHESFSEHVVCNAAPHYIGLTADLFFPFIALNFKLWIDWLRIHY
jgi:hypothetical protein